MFVRFKVLSLILFTIPLLSYSLIHKNESNDLRCSTKKNSNLINKSVRIILFFWILFNSMSTRFYFKDVKEFTRKFFIKFFPSLCILVVFHFLSLYFKCKREHVSNKFEQNSLFMDTLESTANSTKANHQCHLFAFDL